MNYTDLPLGYSEKSSDRWTDVKHVILYEKQATAYDEVIPYNHKQDEGKLVMNLRIAKY